MKNISASPNPHKGQNMKISLKFMVEKGAEKAALSLVYLPDRDILPPEAFATWVQAQAAWQTWEELAGRLLNEFYDEVLPQHMTLELEVEAVGGAGQHIELSAQQPGQKPQLHRVQG